MKNFTREITISTANFIAVVVVAIFTVYFIFHFTYKAGKAAGIAQERAVWNEGR